MNNIIALAASLYIYTALIVNILENCLLSGKWSTIPQPSAWEADALPIELLPQKKSF